MVPSESNTSYELDDIIATRIYSLTNLVDWNAVSAQETSNFNLALALYHEINLVYQRRRTAWGTALGGVLSTSVMALACLFAGVGPWFALAVVIFSQLLRTLWLYWHVFRSQRDVNMLEEQAVLEARYLAQAHPVHDAQ